MKIQFKMKNTTNMELDKIKKGLTRKDIKQVWTVYDEEEMWNSCNFNPFTGKRVESLDDLILSHNEGAFIEDYLHDWNIHHGKFYYFSRVVEPDTEVDIIFELY